jgi:hypothetical protein
VRGLVPTVELSDEKNFGCVRSPNVEMDPNSPVLLTKMSSHFFVGSIVLAFVPKMDIEIAEF